VPRLRRKRDDVQFRLDANFSIEAALYVRDVVHVSQLPQFRGNRSALPCQAARANGWSRAVSSHDSVGELAFVGSSGFASRLVP